MQRALPFLLLAGWLLSALAVAAPTFEPIAAFETGPITPERARLLRHSDGAFYGVSGGEYAPSVIYKVTSAGQISTVVRFPAELSALTMSGLVSDGLGHLWGTAFSGGNARRGAIYKMHPVSGVVSTVVEFTEDELANKGRYPFGGLVHDGASFLWGTTNQGGAANIGTLFKVNVVTGTLTTMVEFSGAGGLAPGAYPRATLVSDGAGGLWGIASQGGSAGAGTVFMVDSATNDFTIVADLDGTNGYSPETELALDGLGYLWTTARFNGANFHGTVFKIQIATGNVTKVVDFSGPTGPAPGSEPIAGLARDASGFMWGTTPAGGSDDVGTLFKINAGTGEFTSVRHFTPELAADRGHIPRATLTADGTGQLWGTTREGGTSDNGTLFRVDPSDGSYVTFAQFTGAADAVSPYAPIGGLTSDAAGFLWGTTFYGGPENRGVIYKVHPATGVVAMVRSFTGRAGVTRGSHPECKLLDAGTGWFWGTTVAGGAADFGTVFKVNVTTGEFASVAEFAGPGVGSAPNRGSYPQAELVSDGAGSLWGTTAAAGTGGRGTVFKVDASTGTLSTIIDFSGPNGAQPVAGLRPDGAGFVWGTTLFGGNNLNGSGGGTVFKIQIATGSFTTVASFTGPDGPLVGLAPRAGLVPDGAGHLWGTTSGGGPDYEGTVFKVNTATDVLTTMLSFTYPNGATPGGEPSAGLVSDGAGSFWGTTQVGSHLGLGTIFKISQSGAFTNAFVFTGSAPPVPGSYPGSGYLHRHTDGHLYGVVSSGITATGIPAGGG